MNYQTIFIYSTICTIFLQNMCTYTFLQIWFLGVKGKRKENPRCECLSLNVVNQQFPNFLFHWANFTVHIYIGMYIFYLQNFYACYLNINRVEFLEHFWVCLQPFLSKKVQQNVLCLTAFDPNLQHTISTSVSHICSMRNS